MQEARAVLALHPRCGAKCKQSEGYCRNAAMKNGRCRLHGGRSTGPKPKHGQASKAANERMKKIKDLIVELKQSLTG